MIRTSAREVRLVLLLCLVSPACDDSDEPQPQADASAPRDSRPATDDAGRDVTATDATASDSSADTSGSDAGADASSAAPLVFKPCFWPDGTPILGLECASLSVPRDYLLPQGERIEIEITRVKSLAPDRIGIMLVNPGGPGFGGATFPAQLLDARKLTERFDMIGFNPRGTGINTRVDCGYSWDTTPLKAKTDADLKAELITRAEREVPAFAAACTAKYGTQLSLNATATTVRDMNEIRKALGEEKISFLGYSYGTWIGAAYALMFPDSVRTFVLDAVMLPESNDLKLLGRESAQARERALGEFAKACQADAACGIPDAISTFDRVLAKAGEAPLTAGLPALSITQDMVLGFFGENLNGVRAWPQLSDALKALVDAADNGAAASERSKAILQILFSAASMAPPKSVFGGFDTHHSILCEDISDRPSVKDAIDYAFLIKSMYPRFYGGALSAVECANWPAAKEPIKMAPLRDPSKVLLIGAYGDPATLFEWSERLATALGGPPRIDYAGAGHGQFLGGVPCIDDAASSFLTGTALPAVTKCAAVPVSFAPPMAQSKLESPPTKAPAPLALDPIIHRPMRPLPVGR